MLDELKEIKYHYLNNSVSSIIDEALNEVTVPSYITVEWNGEGMRISAMYDRYHLCKALVKYLEQFRGSHRTVREGRGENYSQAGIFCSDG